MTINLFCCNDLLFCLCRYPKIVLSCCNHFARQKGTGFACIDKGSLHLVFLFKSPSPHPSFIAISNLAQRSILLAVNQWNHWIIIGLSLWSFPRITNSTAEPQPALPEHFQVHPWPRRAARLHFRNAGQWISHSGSSRCGRSHVTCKDRQLWEALSPPSPNTATGVQRPVCEAALLWILSSTGPEEAWLFPAVGLKVPFPSLA